MNPPDTWNCGIWIKDVILTSPSPSLLPEGWGKDQYLISIAEDGIF